MKAGVADLADVRRIEAEGPPADWPRTTIGLIRRTAQSSPDARALSFFLRPEDHARPYTWTYAEFAQGLARAAILFTELGVRRGDVVAYVLPNTPETHAAIWGGEAVAAVCGVNPLLEVGAIAALLRAVRARAVVTLAPFPNVDLFDKVAAAVTEAPEVDSVCLVDLARYLPGWRRLALALHPARRPGWRQAALRKLGDRKVRWFDVLHRREAAAWPPEQDLPKPDDVSSLFATGGSTGAPKVAVRTHRAETWNVWGVGAATGLDAMAGETALCGLPLFHVNAVQVTGLTPFAYGGHVLLATPQGYRAPGLLDRLWEIVKRHEVAMFSGVPTLFSALLNASPPAGDLASLRFAACGAAPMPVELIRRFESLTGAPVLEGYGLTEGICTSTVNPIAGERRAGSVGLRLPGHPLICARLDEAGRFMAVCDTDEVGAVLIGGEALCKGYVDPKDEAGLWVDAPHEGRMTRFLNTGDLGRLDADGYLWLTGRAKEIIIRGGHNIDPSVIEAALHAHPAVALAAAVPRPDAYAGELPVAYVQLRPGAQADPEALLRFVENAIPERAARPRQVHVVDALPLTTVGKIFKPELKRREAVSALSQALLDAGLTRARISAQQDERSSVVYVLQAPEEELERAREALGAFALPIRWPQTAETRS